MKGHLSLKELETYKKADIQKLARELGVSDEGTIKEIAARCAEVEVEVPDEELTEEEKAELAQEIEKAEAERAAKEAKENEKEAAKKMKEEAERAAGKVKVVVTERYLDIQLNRIKEAGEAFYVEKVRAAELAEKNLVKICG